MKLSKQTRLKLIEAIAQVPKEVRAPEVVVMIVQRVLFESEGEKDWIKEQQRANERLSDYSAPSREAGLPVPEKLQQGVWPPDTLFKRHGDKINQIIDYLQAHYGK